MTQTLKLVSGTSTVMDLLTGNLRVRVNGWSTQSMIGEGEPVWDSLSLVGRAASEGAIGSAVYSVQEFVRQARRNALNVSYEDRLWLHWKPEGGQEVRTLVTDGNLMLEPEPGAGGLGPLMNSDGFVYATLAVQHLPWWEDTTSDNYSGTAFGISYDLTHPNVTSGDLPGRIMQFGITSLSSSTTIDDVWIGIRPDYSEIVSSDIRWLAQDGTMSTSGGGTPVTDASAINGTAVRIDFSGTAAMYQRMRIAASQGAPTASVTMWGKYLVLGRVRCGSNTECIVDLYHGLAQVGSQPQGIEMVGETKVTNTTYKLIELGQVQVPPMGLKVFDGSGTAYVDTNLYIYAQRTAGTSYLYLDAFIMMPCEHLLTIKNAGANATADAIYYRSGSDGKSIAYLYDSTSGRYEIVEHTVNNFIWPEAGGFLVMAGQSTTDHVLSKTCSWDMTVYPRYGLTRV